MNNGGKNVAGVLRDPVHGSPLGTQKIKEMVVRFQLTEAGTDSLSASSSSTTPAKRKSDGDGRDEILSSEFGFEMNF